MTDHMAKILFIAQGEFIAKYARTLQAGLPDPDELHIVVAHMDEALVVARSFVGTDTEVIIARGNTADLLRDSDIPLPVAEVPFGDEEIGESLKQARELAGEDGRIGCFGFDGVIAPFKSLLATLDVHVKFYEIHSAAQIQEQAEEVRRDGVSVIIGGMLTVNVFERFDIKTVLMGTSLASVTRAYKNAKEILAAVAFEKKKTQETQTILNSVSDAIVSMDRDGRLTSLNRLAAGIFGDGRLPLSGQTMDKIFTPDESADIRRVVASGEERIGGILERQGRKYAMRVLPILVENVSQGAVVTLQEIRALQQMEAVVRKGLYQKGNVARYVFDDIKGTSAAIRKAVEVGRSFSRMQSNVLIMGATGTGKEMFAQSMHNASAQREQPFVAVNCGAIPANLIESELFGYEEGAFSGARKGGKAGLFELAHGGTIFLDEISEMGQAGQVSLLRTLQERQVRRVGGASVIPVDVRVIAACNIDLYDLVRSDKFRKDLYYRLSVLILRIPSLSERPEDVAVLARSFVEHYCGQFNKTVTLSDSAVRELESFFWDGNTRQLKNFCERIVALAQESVIDAAFIRAELHDSYRNERIRPEASTNTSDADGPAPSVSEAIIIKRKVYTRQMIDAMLAEHRGNRDLVAKAMGVSRITLWKHLKKLKHHNEYGV